MGFFDRIRGVKPATDDATKQDEKPISPLSTERDFPKRLAALERIDYINKMVFRRTPADMVVHNDGKPAATAGAAMDDASMGLVANLTSLKGAFAIQESGIPDSLLLWYASQGFPGYQVLAIIAQHWLVRKACAMLPSDAMRNGFEINFDDDMGDDDERLNKIKKAISKANKKRGLAQQVVKFMTFGRVFGVRIAVFLVDSDDPQYYEKPFNIDGVKPGSYRGISQIDPYWCAPELSGAASSNAMLPDFYEPTWWLVQGRRVHRSHMCIFKGDEVADVLKPSYLYGGVSIPQKIAERVYASERTANEAPQLAMSKRIRTLFTNFANFIKNRGKAMDALAERAELLNNYGTDVLDKQTDLVQVDDTTLADLDVVIMSQYQIVAAIAETPATKLLGTTPKGFNSTGEFESKSYAQTLATMQATDMEPFIDRHHELLIASDIAPKFNNGVRFEVSISWNEVDTPTSSERADTNLKNAQADQIYMTAGAIDGMDIRSRLTNDKFSGYTGLPSVEESDLPAPPMLTQPDATNAQTPPAVAPAAAK